MAWYRSFFGCISFSCFSCACIQLLGMLEPITYIYKDYDRSFTIGLHSLFSCLACKLAFTIIEGKNLLTLLLHRTFFSSWFCHVSLNGGFYNFANDCALVVRWRLSTNFIKIFTDKCLHFTTFYLIWLNVILASFNHMALLFKSRFWTFRCFILAKTFCLFK